MPDSANDATTSTTSPVTVADRYLAALHANGVRHVFANAGTDFAPIIEGLVKAANSGSPAPDFLTVPHENVAMAMAQGYWKVSGTVAAVMVHVTVGTANALCGIINASRDGTPVLLAAGRTPLTEAGEHGSRNVSIHWPQEARDQAGCLRDYVKWDYELRHGQPVETLVGRALDIARTGPMGPVYMTLPREVLAEPARYRGANEPIAPRTPGAVPAAPAAAAIEQAAAALAGAEFPLIIYQAMRNTAATTAALGALAHDHAIAVCDHAGGALPTSHPMNLGDIRGMPGRFVEIADVIIVIGASVPWVPSFAEPKRDATIVQIAPDPNFADLPHRGFRSDLSIAADPALAVAALADALSALGKTGQGPATDRRRTRIADERRAMDEARAKTLEAARTMGPIHPAWTAHCLNAAKDADALVINELGLPYAQLSIEQPGCYIPGGMASGLGRGLGEALGAKLAAPGRQVIAAIGDGSYMFSVPTAAHFVGRAAGLPTLTLVSNNAEWFAVRRAVDTMYGEGEAVKANRMPLAELAPSPHFHKLLDAFDGHGEAVDDPEKLPAAMDRAFQALADGKQALLNIATRTGGR